MRHTCQAIGIGGGRFARRIVLIAGCIVLMNVAQMLGHAAADALDDLNNEFHQSYGAATALALSSALATRPIVVNRFNEMVLYLPDDGEPKYFDMDGGVYLAERAVTHSVMTLVSRFGLLGQGPFSESDRSDLRRLIQLLRDAEFEVKNDPMDLSNPKDSLATLSAVRRIAESVLQRSEVTEEDKVRLASVTRPLIDASLYRAAKSQLDQFRDQLDTWKSDYPAVDWSSALIFTVATHQPRKGYSLSQVFRWWLERAGGSENNVYYIEVVIVPKSLSTTKPEEILKVASKIIFDRSASEMLFGDEFRLESDVLAPAASDIIKTWSTE